VASERRAVVYLIFADMV
jgi:hypothetical protein